MKISRTIYFYLVFALLSLFASSSGFAQSPVDSCTKTCVINTECGVGGLCNNGACTYQPHFCANERWAVNDRGETSNCDAYRCANESGTCLRVAANSQDCLTGYVFDGVSACVASVSCAAGDSPCADLYNRWLTARQDYEKTTPEPSPTLLSCLACDPQNSCGGSLMCWQNRCVAEGPYCQTDGSGEQFVYTNAGPQADCGSFSCDRSTSSCLTQCLKTDDCRSGKSCVAGTCL